MILPLNLLGVINLKILLPRKHVAKKHHQLQKVENINKSDKKGKSTITDIKKNMEKIYYFVASTSENGTEKEKL